MNENKKISSKAWPLAAAALALGLGGVVGASAVFADRADDAANVCPSQSVKMRASVADDILTIYVPFGNYVNIHGESVAVISGAAFPGESEEISFGNSLDEANQDEGPMVAINEMSVDSSGVYLSLAADLYGESTIGRFVGSLGDDEFVWVFDIGAADVWTSAEYQNPAGTNYYYNYNVKPKGLISETFDAVTGGVTGVAGAIGTGVTSVVGLFWDVENVKFTTLGTLTLVGLAAGLVYFAIRTIYRAVNGVA